MYTNFWQPTLEAGGKRRFIVMVINDEYREATGKLTLSLETSAGNATVRSERPFTIPALGQQTYKFDLEIPSSPGDFILKAVADARQKLGSVPTISRRKVKVISKT